MHLQSEQVAGGVTSSSMAGLGALLGGYGSDEDASEEQQGSPANAMPLLGILGGAASASPNKADDLARAAAAAGGPTGAAAVAASTISNASQQPSAAAGGAAGAESDSDISGRRVRVMDGPSTNPEPPPEGLSPPLGDAGLNGLSAGEQQDEAGSEDVCDPAWLSLPPELRDPPPGEMHPVIQDKMNTLFAALGGQNKSGKKLLKGLATKRRWNNPDFLEKMVRYYQLDQYGTSLDPEVFDPKSIPEEDLWPALAAQLAARKRARGAEVKFTSSGQQQAGAAGAPTAAAAGTAAAAPKMLPPDPRKVEAAQAQAQALAQALLSGAKKSKWDK